MATAFLESSHHLLIIGEDGKKILYKSPNLGYPESVKMRVATHLHGNPGKAHWDSSLNWFHNKITADRLEGLNIVI